MSARVPQQKNPPAGCSKRPSSKAAGKSKPEAYTQGYIEDFDEPRTMQAAFFSILPTRPLPRAHRPAYDASMQVQLSHPARTVEVKGPKKVKDLLRELNLVVEAHLVIKGDDLVTEDEMLYDADQVEIRPVISGG